MGLAYLLTDAKKYSYALWTGLPDFSWCNIPKQGKMYQILTKCTECLSNILYKIYTKFLMSIEYTNIFHSKAQKISPNCDFWFENIPSGNPGCGCLC
jgi:hypothetical protein